MGAVSIRDVSVGFGAVNVLSGLSLDVADGEFVVLLGASGCGKSTLLNAIAGLIEVSAGQIWIGGRNVTWAEPKDRGIGMVFQSYSLYPRMTVEGNLSFGMRIAGKPADEVAKRVARAAGMLHLEPLLARRPAELSGGQRQRVAIGRALVKDADVFLFDEPLSNLDAKLRNELRVEIKKLHLELGSTMVYVTHDQVEALTLADRIAIMDRGVIQQFAGPREIYRRPANRFVADFIGSPAMNMFDGALEDGGRRFASPQGSADLSAYEFAGAARPARATMGVRPEHVAIGPAPAGHAALSGKVSIVEPMGGETVLWADCAGKPVSVKLDGETKAKPGDDMTLHFDPAEASLFDAASGARL
ncbi:MAG: ABC transporter ATP-binding protein [Hyphomicrobiales bacterium]|nr:ABC transporter ATP-binding protein [Hyphomicrobiales bacterium]MDE2016309.1 ABC transporter ATP-binding protein [Hyphomicrobiales bacterium]